MKQRRAAMLVLALLAIPVAGGAVLLRLAPWETAGVARAPEPVVASSLAQTSPQAGDQAAQLIFAPPVAASSFAPALRLRTYLPPPAPAETNTATAEAAPNPGPAQPAMADAATPQSDAPAAAASDAPLPPTRPADLALVAEPPLPPARPAGLDGQVAGDQAPDGQAPVGQAPDGKIVVAALTPPLTAPETKPPLAETAPLPAPQAAIEPAPDVPFAKGQPAYVRIFKKEGELELWLKRGPKYALYKSWPICKWSGHLGPKLREGDYQSPEGFYSVSAKQLNPNSHYHLAFNVGFPNALDRQLGYTGGLVMVHGNCQSVGCFAMTDRGIDEIYGYVAAAIANGQKEVPVHIFPFRMSNTQLAQETGAGLLAFASTANERYGPFWRNLKEGYDLFEKTGAPPTAYACNGRYAFNGSAACKRIAGW